MEILMNLLPPCLAHCVSYKVVNWAGFPTSFPVVVDMGRNIDSHVDENPEICKNL